MSKPSRYPSGVGHSLQMMSRIFWRRSSFTLSSSPRPRPHRTHAREELLQGALPRSSTPGSDRAMRTSENAQQAKFAEFTFRNCLENRNGSRVMASKAPRRGRRGVDRQPLGGKNARSRGLRLFSKQFLQALRWIASLYCLLLLLAYHHHRAVSVPHNRIGDAPHQGPSDPPSSPAAHHDEPRPYLLCQPNNLLRRSSLCQVCLR